MGRGEDAGISLGVLRATSEQFSQIETWVAEFRRGAAQAKVVVESSLERYDLYLIVVETADELANLVMKAALTLCVVLAVREDEALVDAALAAGAVDLLVLPTLDAGRLERTVYFGLARRQLVDMLSARELCLAATRERERQQLANTLHDGPMQDLIGARFLVGALGMGSATVDIQESLQQVVQTLRALCSELKPPTLGPFGLEKALRAYLQSWQARFPAIKVSLELDIDQQHLPEWARLALFRVFQGAMSNVEKHAGASNLWVRLLLDNATVRLTVADDGQGFELPSSWLDFARTERCGLLVMQERVDALQGQMVVQSTVGSGTRVIVQVPSEQPPQPIPPDLPSATLKRNGQKETDSTQ